MAGSDHAGSGGSCCSQMPLLPVGLGTGAGGGGESQRALTAAQEGGQGRVPGQGWSSAPRGGVAVRPAPTRAWVSACHSTPPGTSSGTGCGVKPTPCPGGVAMGPQPWRSPEQKEGLQLSPNPQQPAPEGWGLTSAPQASPGPPQRHPGPARRPWPSILGRRWGRAWHLHAPGAVSAPQGQTPGVMPVICRHPPCTWPVATGLLAFGLVVQGLRESRGPDFR